MNREAKFAAFHPLRPLWPEASFIVREESPFFEAGSSQIVVVQEDMSSLAINSELGYFFPAAEETFPCCGKSPGIR